MSENLVEVKHLQQYFPAGGMGKNKQYVQAVDDVSFAIRKGETLGLVGESGCGKTTTGRTLLRLYEPTDGTIIYDGKVLFDKKEKIAVDMLPYRRRMQIVFQDPYASLDPRMTIGDIVGEGFPVVEYSANDAGYHIPVAEYVQQAWGELGITVNINKVEWASFLPMRRAGDFDISRNGWSMDYNDPSNMLELFTTNNGNNDGKYANPAFDKLIEESRVADKATHFEKLHEAEDMLMADAACIPVAYYNDFWLQSPSLKGTWHSPYGYWYLQYGYIEE